MQSNFKRPAVFSLFILGLSTLITQVVYMREALTVFAGNELVIGLILSCWMLFTGTGAYFARFQKNINITALLITIAVSALIPLLSIFGLFMMKALVFPPGIMLGIPQIMMIILITLAPFCIISGYLFVQYATLLSSDEERKIDLSYAIEAAGSTAGGIIFYMMLMIYFDPFRMLVFILISNLFAAFLFARQYRSVIPRLLLLGLLSFSLFFLAFVDLNKISEQALYPSQEILLSESTPFGKVVVSSMNDQINFFVNGQALPSAEDPVYTEEAVHYAMIQADKPENILLISGGLSGMVDEILKYNEVVQIDYLEINPSITEIAKIYAKLPDSKKLNIHNDDVIGFLSGSAKKYDVILVNSSDPLSAGINRYYSIEFFRLLKSHLSLKGVIMSQLSSHGNYLTEEAKRLNSIHLNTLSAVFTHCLYIPGSKNFYVSSDRVLQPLFVDLLEGLNEENKYVNKYFLRQDLIDSRSEQFISSLDDIDFVNTNIKPLAYYHSLRYWLEHFRTAYWIFLIIPLAMILFSIIRMNPVNTGLFAGGFTAVSTEFVLLLSIQLLYGFIYQYIGLIITLFMLGLAAGAYFSKRIIKIASFRSFTKITLLIALLAVVTPMPLIFLQEVILPSQVGVVIISVLIFIIAFVVGLQFASATIISTGGLRKIASGTYGADLLGSAAGAFLVAIFLVPVLGILNACLVIAAFDVCMIGIMIIKKR